MHFALTQDLIATPTLNPRGQDYLAICEYLDQARGEVTRPLESLRTTRPDFEYELSALNSVLPSMTGREAPIVQTIARAIEDVIDKSPD